MFYITVKLYFFQLNIVSATLHLTAKRLFSVLLLRKKHAEEEKEWFEVRDLKKFRSLSKPNTFKDVGCFNFWEFSIIFECNKRLH